MEGLSEMHDRAAAMLDAIWRGVPRDYKSRYRRTIWQQFEDNISAAAYTNSLGKFLNGLSLALNITIQNRDDVALLNDVLARGEDKALLRLMREQTTLLVLMVRLRNQERQEDWKARRAEREVEEKAMADALFGLPEEGAR